jgi:hypothetical protein
MHDPRLDLVRGASEGDLGDLRRVEPKLEVVSSHVGRDFLLRIVQVQNVETSAVSIARPVDEKPRIFRILAQGADSNDSTRGFGVQLSRDGPCGWLLVWVCGMQPPELLPGALFPTHVYFAAIP